jgi:hypothetical protein
MVGENINVKQAECVVLLIKGRENSSLKSVGCEMWGLGYSRLKYY